MESITVIDYIHYSSMTQLLSHFHEIGATVIHVRHEFI